MSRSEMTESFNKEIQQPLLGWLMINTRARHEDCVLELHYVAKEVVPL